MINWKELFENSIGDHEQYNHRLGDTVSLRASMAGDCPRLLDYRLQDADHEGADLSGALRMQRGTWLGKSIATHWQCASDFNLDDLEKEVDIKLPNGGVCHGHIDGYFAKENLVWELKCVSRESYTKIQKQECPLPAHLEQGNLYASAIEGCEGILFQYYNTNTGESQFFEVPFNKALADMTKAKFEQAEDNQVKAIKTDRPYTNPENAPCWFCNYKEKCWDGYKKDFKDTYGTDTEIPIEDKDFEDLVTWCADTLRANQERLQSKKIEDRSKDLISDNILKRKLKFAWLELHDKAYTISIKLGVKNNPLTTIKETSKGG